MLTGRRNIKLQNIRLVQKAPLSPEITGIFPDTKLEIAAVIASHCILNTESNVQFGEGGAGTFSDGKLTTNTKDFRHSFILKTFVEFGAPEEILYEAKAHIGTDYLIKVVKNIREEVIRLGGIVLFDSKMTEVISENGTLTGVKYISNGAEKEIKTNSLILAIGHSARDTFYALKGAKIIKNGTKAFCYGCKN